MTTRKGVIEGDDRVLAGTGYGSKDDPNAVHVIDRSRDLPIEFTGRKIGYGKVGSDLGSTEVTIYVTAGEQIVCHVSQVQSRDRRFSKAEVFKDGKEALEWLRDGKGELGKASKDAWTQACATHEPIEHLARISVE